MSYKEITLGSQDEDVRIAQELLNSTGRYNLEVDGIFGQQTSEAVKEYQRENGLVVDGVIGPQTWASLTGGTTEAPETPKTDYQVYTERLEGLYDAWANRDPFSYDVQADPLYRQYKDLYTHQGRLAMMDTLGQAAALTGGYGNTYAQTAGQQTFQNYMQQLSQVVPELYSMAYDRYNDEGDRLLKEYQLTQSRAEDAYIRQNDSYAKLVNLLPLGYMPTDEELRAAGLTQAQLDAILSSYQSGGGGGYVNLAEGVLTSEQVAKLQAGLLGKGYNITVDGVYGTQTQAAVNDFYNKDTSPLAAYMGFALVDGFQSLFRPKDKE